MRAPTDYAFDLRRFGELTTAQLYALLRLRAEVFVVEQDCAYQDLDGRDADSLHLLQVGPAHRLVGYARLLPAGLDFAASCAIGRIVTAPKVRRAGYGRPLVREAIRRCGELWPGVPVDIRAQVYLDAFYRGLGFEPFGKTYLEDGIPHVDMRYREPTRPA